jgi:hypothetical protein
MARESDTRAESCLHFKGKSTNARERWLTGVRTSIGVSGFEPLTF